MIVVALIGLALAIGGFLSLRSNSKFMKTAVKTEGEIIEVKREQRSETDEDGYTSTYFAYVPVLSFSVDGKEYNFKSTVSSRSKRKYKLGNTMVLFYNPEDPSNAKVKSTMNNVVGPILLIVVGVLMIIGGFIG